jgi:UDP-N-acetylmuramoyl-L-alanyl-D-glutamate--2,6-diaminopimelate ligase
LDNPRTEDPDAIIRDIVEGIPAGTDYRVVADRASAIRLALVEARSGDTVVLAGKGHETYQEIQGVKHPFDDREVAERIMKEMGAELHADDAA